MGETGDRPGSPDLALLREANQALVLAMLQAEEEAEQRAANAEGRELRSAPSHRHPSRELVLERISAAITGCRSGGARFALLFVDLGNFHRINQALGPRVGERVLAVATRRLRACVGAHDVVCRYGADQFVVLLAEVVHAADATAAAERVIGCLGQPHRLGEHVVRLSASIGISMYPRDGHDPATLLDLADVAMLDARRAEPGRALVAPPLAALQRPIMDYQQSRAEYDRRHGQLRETNEQLLMAALDAQDLKAAADLAHRQLTEFLAMLAHELRNPLAPIRNAASLMNSVPHAELPALQAVIERQVKYMSRLVGDLLDVSRVSTGKLRLEPEWFDLTTVLDSAVEACRPAMDTRLQTFTLKVPATPLRVHGDPMRLTQVVSNLLDNASKYTPRGEQVRLSVAVQGDRLVMTVSDTGIGISPDAITKIFEPFVQDTHAVAFSGAGLGIGLTVVRELVEAHGGRVTVASPGLGQGSLFTVSLPLAAP